MEGLTTILKRDHRNLDAKLAELAEADDSEQEAMVDEIQAAFERHAELLYPHLEASEWTEIASEASESQEQANEGAGAKAPARSRK